MPMQNDTRERLKNIYKVVKQRLTATPEVGAGENALANIDEFLSDLAKQLPEGYSLVVTGSSEASLSLWKMIGFGGEGVVGRVYQWNGEKHFLFGSSLTGGSDQAIIVLLERFICSRERLPI